MQLEAEWAERNEVVDGHLLLEDADEALLEKIGCSATTAIKIMKAVRALQAGATQVRNGRRVLGRWVRWNGQIWWRF